MAALVLIEAIAIAFLGLLVFGLLRSHAEILRSLHDLGAGVGEVDHGHAVRPAPGGRSRAASDVVGVTVDDEPVSIGIAGAGHGTLLAFLTTGCLTCAGFWKAFRDGVSLPAQARLVVVTKGPADESGSRVRELLPADYPTVMSSEAWQGYEVPVAPYFVYVDGPSARVMGEGAAGTWDQVRSLMGQALDDSADVGSRRDRRRAQSFGRDDVARDERTLLAAGITPGHPSLYPSPDAADQRDEA